MREVKNFYPFPEMPSVEKLDELEARAIRQEKNGFDDLAKKTWAKIEIGEQYRREAGLDIYNETKIERERQWQRIE